MVEAEPRPDLEAQEQMTMRDRVAMGSMGVGLLALAMPVVLIIGRSIKAGVDSILERLGIR
jgi:hypothetical protein